MLQGLVSNEGDGWQWTLEELDRYYEASAAQSFASERCPGWAASLLQLSRSRGERDSRASMSALISTRPRCLGRRTAELHLALASPTPGPGVHARTADVRRTSTGCAKS